MEKLIAITANGINHLRIIKARTFYKLEQKSQIQMIRLLMLSLFIIGSFSLLYADFSFFNLGFTFKIFLLISYLILAFSSLILVASYYRSKSFSNLKSYKFDFKKLAYNQIDYDELKLDKDEIEDFHLLISGEKVSKRINFKFLSTRSKEPSYRALFCFLHCIIENGIYSFKEKNKDELFHMVEETFLMNGKSINLDTLSSSFSTWKGKMDEDKYSEMLSKFNKSINKG